MKFQTFRILSQLNLVFLLTISVSCSSDVETREVKRDVDSNATVEDGKGGSGNKPGVRTTKNDGSSEDSKTSTSGGETETETGSTGTGTTGSEDDMTGNQGSGASDAERMQAALTFFESNLETVLEAACISCHVGPRVEVAQRGTEGIYVAENMYELMVDGTSSSENPFYNMVSNRGDAHPGGDRCASSQNICDLIVEFGQFWYEDDGSVAPPDPEFGFLHVQAINGASNFQGLISGWAFNSAQPDEQVMVEIFNGPMETGTLLVTDTANRQGLLPGKTIPPGNHKFAVQIPAAMIDHGNEMDIYAYAVINGERMLIGNAKETYYSLQDPDFFNQQVAGSVTAGSCGNCHASWTLQGVYETMVIPKPSNGGTATNNKFYLAITNANGHSGGNQGAALANLLRQWWEAEFGP